MAAGEGFEPSHTESESAVLPLHNPAKRMCYYTVFLDFVKSFFHFSGEIFCRFDNDELQNQEEAKEERICLGESQLRGRMGKLL